MRYAGERSNEAGRKPCDVNAPPRFGSHPCSSQHVSQLIHPFDAVSRAVFRAL